jgi:hypothetical protein
MLIMQRAVMRDYELPHILYGYFAASLRRGRPAEWPGRGGHFGNTKYRLTVP